MITNGHERETAREPRRCHHQGRERQHPTRRSLRAARAKRHQETEHEITPDDTYCRNQYEPMRPRCVVHGDHERGNQQGDPARPEKEQRTLLVGIEDERAPPRELGRREPRLGISHLIKTDEPAKQHCQSCYREDQDVARHAREQSDGNHDASEKSEHQKNVLREKDPVRRGLQKQHRHRGAQARKRRYQREQRRQRHPHRKDRAQPVTFEHERYTQRRRPSA